MELTKIVIENYKSIRSPATISFSPNMPTVLIGKNGCGKTTVLEALYKIAEANRIGAYGREKGDLLYKARIQLSEEDVKAVLPLLKYDPSQCEIVAYGGNQYLQMDRIESPYIVPSFKKEIADIAELANRLAQVVNVYEKQVGKLSGGDDAEFSLQSCVLKHEDGGLTNFGSIQRDAEQFLNNIRIFLQEVQTNFVDEKNEYIYGEESFSLRYYSHHPPESFQLEYREPTLAAFVQKHITINKAAIKREITRINKATKESCDRINELINEINERTIRIQDGLRKEKDRYWDDKLEKDERYNRFLTRVQQIIGRKCLFLRNENKDVIFQKPGRDYYDNAQKRNDSILETYLRYACKGEGQGEVRGTQTRKRNLTQEELKEFETYLKKNLPDFEKEMYRCISVEKGDDGQPVIYLIENTGDRVELNETSAGRRWYFTYYFMKNLLDEGDIFIIDEPAATLHPLAQREVMAELTELVRRGIKVVYSTHSPYLIPKEWQSVHCVTMTKEGTKVDNSFSNRELTEQIVGTDIFDLSDLISKYETCDVDQITKNAYKLVIATQKERSIPNQQTACAEIGISLDTLKSWNQLPRDNRGNENKDYHKISLENLIKVLKWAEKAFEDVLN